MKTGLHSGWGDTCPMGVSQSTVPTSRTGMTQGLRAFKRKRALLPAVGEDTSGRGEDVYSGLEGQMARCEEGRAFPAEGTGRAQV